MSEGQSVERRLVSILFADLVGFTSLSESLDAEEVSAVQARYFEQVREIVGRHGGRLEKFIGDAAMAVFGLPRTRDDDAERAVRAGLALLNSIEVLSVTVGLGEGELRLRVGISSGEVAYAAAEDGEWRVSGDTVNVAARLQAAAEPGTALVGEGTALAVAESIAMEPPIELELKGKAQPVRAWRAVTVLPTRSRERAMAGMRAPLLGREQEIERVEESVARVRAGANEALIIVAPPGVGKTRLVDELAGRAASGLDGERPLVLRARLGPETISPAAAVTQLLVSALDEHLDSVPADDALRQLPRVELMVGLLDVTLDRHRAAELKGALTVLLTSDGSDPDQVLPSASELAQERHVRHREWIDGLGALARGRTQIWLIEDLHWAGGDMLALIEQAAVQAAPRGRLLLGTARPSFLEQLSQRPDGTPALPLLELAPLSPASAADLLSALVGDALPPALASALVQRSDGNPLFIEELLRSWVSVGILSATDEGSWSLSRPVEEIPLPQTVQAIYSAQLDDLPSGARTLVRRASVAGRYVPRHSLSSLEVTDPDAALDVVRRRALLTDSPPDVVVGPALSYRHVLLRDAGYASLARAERARLHARLASWYQHVAGPRVDEVAELIARHYAAAAEHTSRLSPQIESGLDAARARELAVEWYERAAGGALAMAAHETARSLLRQALELTADSDRLSRARLQVRLGEATAYTADMNEGERLLSEAVESYRRAFAQPEPGEDRAAARRGYASAAAALGRVWVQQIRFDDAGRVVDEALTAIGGPEDEGVARLLAVRGWVRSTLTAERSTIADLDRALSIARDVGDRRLELEILDWRAAALGEVDLVTLEDWQLVEQLAVELGDGSRAVRAMRARAGWLVDDEHGQVWAIADRAEEIARGRGGEEDLAWLDYLRSEAGFVSGQWDRAMESGARAVEIGERNAYHRAVVRTWHVLLPIAEARGDRRLIEHAFRWYEDRRGTFPDSPYARIVEAAAELHFMHAGLQPYVMPSVEPRLASFESEPGGPSWTSALQSVIESWLAGGELAGVRDALQRLERAAAASPDTSSLGRGSVMYLRARLKASESDAPGAADLARGAAGHFRTSQAPWWIANSLRVLANVGEARGRELDELRSIAERLRLVDAQ